MGEKHGREQHQLSGAGPIKFGLVIGHLPAAPGHPAGSWSRRQMKRPPGEAEPQRPLAIRPRAKPCLAGPIRSADPEAQDEWLMLDQPRPVVTPPLADVEGWIAQLRYAGADIDGLRGRAGDLGDGPMRR
jgi:hypothetical protein